MEILADISKCIWERFILPFYFNLKIHIAFLFLTAPFPKAIIQYPFLPADYWIQGSFSEMENFLKEPTVNNIFLFF